MWFQEVIVRSDGCDAQKRLQVSFAVTEQCSVNTAAAARRDRNIPSKVEVDRLLATQVLGATKVVGT